MCCEQGASFPVVNRVSVSSDAQFVVVADDDVAMLVDDVACCASSSELSGDTCKRPTESFVSPFDETDCLGGAAVDHEYAEEEGRQQSLCMMDSVADSYEDRSLMTMDRVSVICSGQKEEPDCCSSEQLSSTHEQVLDSSG